MKDHLTTSLLSVLSVMTLVHFTNAAPIYFPGTGHYYDIVKTTTTWTGAKAAAEASTFNGVNGYLVSINSEAENTFLASVIAPAANSGSIFQAWVGGYQPVGSPEPAGNWSWVSGEPWVYSNWAPGQPNNDWGGNEHNLVFYIKPTVFGNTGEWGDARNVETMYYMIEYVPEPGSSLLVLLGAGLVVCRRLR